MGSARSYTGSEARSAPRRVGADSPEVVIGLDMGTTSSKAVAYDRRGRKHAESARAYPLESPRPHRAEQDPEVVLGAAKQALCDVALACASAGAHVVGVAVGAAMHGVLALGRDGSPLTPLLTWADTRASAQASALRARRDGFAVYRRTGTPLHPMSPLAKLLWFRDEDADTWRRATKWVSIKEYMFLRLLDELVVDHSMASATGLMSLAALDWDDGVLELVGLERAKLSRLVRTTEIVGRLDARRAGELGLASGTPVVAGAGDGVLATLGAGAIRDGVAACTIGTSGAVRMRVPTPRTEERGKLFCYALSEDDWIVGGPISNGGVALRWLRDEVLPAFAGEERAAGRDPYTAMTAMAEAVPAGADGLLFLPHLLGERAPQWDPHARAAWIGLTIRHGRAHLVRSVMEGVVYQLLAVLAVLETVGGEAHEMRATGGFSRSPTWRQIMADVFGTVVCFPSDPHSSSLGAAALGMKALGVIATLGDVDDMVTIAHRHEPRPRESGVYRELAAVFMRLYDDLAEAFGELARLERSLEEERAATPPP